MERWIYRVYGRVQGVGFRQSVFERVHSKISTLKGYVKNMEDGSVEILAEGENSDLETLREYAQQGPRMSKVDKVDVEKQKIEKVEYEDFLIDF